MNTSSGSYVERFTLAPPLPASRGWIMRAESAQAPVALIVPALGVAARSYERFGAALREAGLHAACVDLRGVGSSPLRAARGVDWGYLELVDGELAALYDEVRRRLPEAPTVLVGHSLGGQLAMLQQARQRHRPAQAVVLLASGSPWIRAFPRYARPAVAAFVQLTRASCIGLGVFRGDWLRFGGRQPARLMLEWASHARHGRFGRLGAEQWDADAALRNSATPVIGMPMGRDAYTLAAATRHLADMSAGALRWAPLDTIDGRAPGHFGWMRTPVPVARRLAELLAEMPASSPASVAGA